MKNIVIGVASAIVLVLLLFCIYTLQGDATRKTESSDSITQAMENAAAKMTEDEEVYTGNEEFRTAFVQNLMLQLDSASDVKVKILMSDYQKGLIQAEVTQHYKTPRGDCRSHPLCSALPGRPRGSCFCFPYNIPLFVPDIRNCS